MSELDKVDIHIVIDEPVFRGTVAIVIEQDGAEYIAAVMEREAERTGDLGAVGIARRIRRGLGQEGSRDA